VAGGGGGARALARRLGRSTVLKRAIDVVGALAALILFAPLMLVAAAATRWSMGSPVLFKQLRPGLRGRPFTLYKFRTMVDLRDEHGELLPDTARITRLGRLLRSTSLDELPELLSVLAGHMSLVGPRPLLLEYVPLYTPWQARRHEVKPGITGWAQVNGRNALSWEQKLALDIWYVDNWTVCLDAKILAMTVGKVLRREGIGAPDLDATTPKFTGTKESGETPA